MKYNNDSHSIRPKEALPNGKYIALMIIWLFVSAFIAMIQANGASLNYDLESDVELNLPVCTFALTIVMGILIAASKYALTF